MGRINLCGGFYSGQSPNVDPETTHNWIPEQNESPGAKAAISLLPRGGLLAFATLPGEDSVPQMFTQNGRLFAAGLHLWELFANGTATDIGALSPIIGLQIFMTANQNQLLISSGGSLYIFDFTTNVLTPVNMAQFNDQITAIDFAESFFIALQRNSQVFYVSNPLDGTTWQAVNAEQVSLFTDNIVSLIVSHGELLIGGSKASVAYGNSGAAQSPFVPVSSSTIESGSCALGGPCRLDNTVFWMEQDERGNLIARRLNGYQPQRVSNHALEYVWSTYTTVSDLVTFSLQMQGHTFWVLYFPTANVTWVYDVATGLWHIWDFVDPLFGTMAFRGRCHAFAFGKHLIGDWRAGTIYEMSPNYLDDFGTPIQRVRITPNISQEGERIFFSKLQIDLEPGLASFSDSIDAPTILTLADSAGGLWQLTADDTGNLVATSTTYGTAATIILNDDTNAASWQVGVTADGLPQTTSVALNTSLPKTIPLISAGLKQWSLGVSLEGLLETTGGGPAQRGATLNISWSNDGGKTWSNQYPHDCGKLGEYTKRVIQTRMGSDFQRCYKIQTSDAWTPRIADGYLTADPGYQPQARMGHELAKRA